MSINQKHFYNTSDFSQEELNYLIGTAIKMKKGSYKKTLTDKVLTMLFFNPSLRTRVSFTVAMQKLGGLAIDYPISAGKNFTFEFQKGAIMNKATMEHVKDAAQVLSRYTNAISIRCGELITTSTESVVVPSWDELKKDIVHKSFMEYGNVPVINMESNVYHPCQGLGDAMTMKEKLGKTKGKKYSLIWSYHPKALPMATPNSQILAACDLGMDVTVAHPIGWELDTDIVKQMKQRVKQSGGSFEVSNSQDRAYKDASVICTKSWGALKFYGNWGEEKKIREQKKDWIVNAEKMKKTDHALFMHCLPVRRNVEVTDEVIDGKNSVVIEEAENRLWVQMAILQILMHKK